MTEYRVSVMVNPDEPTFCAYGGPNVKLALDHAGQYDWAYMVSVEYKHEDCSWRVVTSREGTNGIAHEDRGIQRDVVGARHDSRLGY